MSTTLALRFPWGRYHATPWGRHLNEGVTEWPPSCWRLLRGLYATWVCRASEIHEERVRALLDALADPPTYWLPEAVDGHSRHYMPDTLHRLGVDGHVDKAFDPFMAFERDGEVFVRWDLDLDEDLRHVFHQLVELLPHVGRADSICEGHLLDADEVPTGERVAPVSADQTQSSSVRLLVPVRPVDLDALAVDTLHLRSSRVVMPPGAKWVDYRVPNKPDTRLRTARRSVHDQPTAARWAVITSARPSLYSTVVMCDALRSACMSVFGRLHDERVSPILAGKEPNGRPLLGHAHAHYLALDADGDQLLDHLLVWAPRGFGFEELQAIAAITDLRGHGYIREFRPCRLGLEVVGSIGQAAPELVGPSRRWESLTPFAPPRHRKRRQTHEEFLTAEVVRELKHRGLPEPDDVVVRRGRALAFRRHRIRSRLEDAVSASDVSVEFPKEVRGPIAIGALSHFGLGILAPEK